MINSTDNYLCVLPSLNKENVELNNIESNTVFRYNYGILAENINSFPKVLTLENNGLKKATNTSKSLFGVITNTGNIGHEKKLITKGIITFDLLDAEEGQSVYCDNNGDLTLIKGSRKVGFVLSNISTMKIFINIGREYDENNPKEIPNIDNPQKTTYSTLRTISYYYPWQPNPMPRPTVNINTSKKCFAYGKNKLILAAERYIYSSDDFGKTWQLVLDTLTKNFQDIIFHNDKFILIDFTGSILISFDGVIWNGATIASRPWSAITYNEAGRYVVVADGQDYNDCIAISDDGETWSLQTISDSEIWTDIEYGNNYFIITSIYTNKIGRSIDGINWQFSTISGVDDIRNIIFGKDKFYAIAGGSPNKVISSFDGSSWNILYTDVSIQQIKYGNDTYIAFTTTDKIKISKDIENWKEIPSGWVGNPIWPGKIYFVNSNFYCAYADGVVIRNITL